MIYIKFSQKLFKQTPTEAGPDNLADDRKTSTIPWTVSWISASLKTMDTDWSFIENLVN